MSYIRDQTADEAFEVMLALKQRATEKGCANLKEFLELDWDHTDKFLMMRFAFVMNKILMDSDNADGRFE